VENPERKRPLRRPKRGWEGIIRMHPKYIGGKVMDGTNLAQDSGSG
jgi:hypothetical protein